ncbi:MAG: tRNA pseudouridine(38-40) synthase TruA, partial [Gemmatimonadaceae bacterium]
RYTYHIGTDEEANSPFRRRYELAIQRPVDRDALDEVSGRLVGLHCFRAFAVRGTAPEHDDHRCQVHRAHWRDRAGGLAFEIEANRFLHHMVRFLVGTMLDIGTGRRPADDLAVLLAAGDNRDVSPPAAAHALFLDGVTYPSDLYVS